MNEKELKEIVMGLIATGREDDWWDFKECHHEDKAALVHDIICMANSRGQQDGLIIIGVRDKSMEIIGCENDSHRRNQQQIVDILRTPKFAGQIRPRVEVRTISIQRHEIDVYIVKNTSDTPYYLIEDYYDRKYNAQGKQGKTVHAAHIYCRVMDNNTPIDQNADLIDIEALWKKRFGLLQTPLEQLSLLLDRPENWEEEESVYYHRQFPQFTIKVLWDADIDNDIQRTEHPEFYHYMQTDHMAYYGMLRIYHYGTQMYSCQVTGLDGHRSCVPCPEWEFIGDKDIWDGKISYKYYVRGTLNFKLLQFFTHHYDETNGNEASVAVRKHFRVVLLFDNNDQKEIFDNYVQGEIGTFYSKLSEENYPEIESDNAQEIVKATTEIKTGFVLKKMLHELTSCEKVIHTN